MQVKKIDMEMAHLQPSIGFEVEPPTTCVRSHLDLHMTNWHTLISDSRMTIGFIVDDFLRDSGWFLKRWENIGMASLILEHIMNHDKCMVLVLLISEALKIPKPTNDKWGQLVIDNDSLITSWDPMPNDRDKPCQFMPSLFSVHTYVHCHMLVISLYLCLF